MLEGVGSKKVIGPLLGQGTKLKGFVKFKCEEEIILI